MQPVMQFKSHIEGKNADVTIWPDRIEYQRLGARRGLSAKALVASAGMSALASFSRKSHDTNMIPIRAIQGVTTHKGGIAWTEVELTTGGDKIAFRVTKDQAGQVKSTISRLMLG